MWAATVLSAPISLDTTSYTMVASGPHEVVEDQEGEPVENFLVILDQG